MAELTQKPRLIRYDDVAVVVRELKRLGVSGRAIYERVTEIGPVDLDMLNEVIRQDRHFA